MGGLSHIQPLAILTNHTDLTLPYSFQFHSSHPSIHPQLSPQLFQSSPISVLTLNPPSSSPIHENMPFRSKLKKAFGGGSKDSGPGGTTSSVSDAIAKKDKSAKKHKWNKKTNEWENWPENVYKPYEIPAPKYKRPPAKEHTKKLEKFTWDTDAHADDRRPSATSQYSPMGSKLQSRRSSQVGPDGEVLEGTAPVEGVDPADVAASEGDADGAELTRTETIKAAAPTAGAADAVAGTQPPKVSAGTAESKTDAFNSGELTRALTAIKDGNSTAAGTGTTAVGA